MRQIADYVHEYEGYGRCPSRCRIRFYGAGDRPPVFLLRELTDNPGTSITNMAEYLAAELAARHGPQRLEEHEPLLWIEHYLRTERERRLGMVEYSLATFSSYRPCVERYHGSLRRKLGAPAWKYVDKEMIREILGS
jgi:hypothetical protein